jgi:hypothetical protein
MSRTGRTIQALTLALVAGVSISLAASPPLLAEVARPGDEGANVQLTLTVIDTTADGVTSEHSVSALALDGRSAQLRTGWKLPIPETTFNTAMPAAGEVVPVTRFSYQDVGLYASLQGRRLEGERVRVSGRVEISAVDEAASASTPAPRLGTFRHDFEVVLLDGVGATVAEVTKPHGGSLLLSISASTEP